MDDAFTPQDPLGILSPAAPQQDQQERAVTAAPAVSTGRGLSSSGEKTTSLGLNDAERPIPAPTGRSSSLKEGIIASASALGVNPLDLATAISYETAGTFNPTKRGPTTQWGQHQGLIQFGKPQAAKYGVDWNDPIGSQLGENGAVVKYLRDTGVRPGMGLLDIYSAINAGGVGRYNRSDANNGGAPGTVADKVSNQMSGHRAKAAALLGGSLDVSVASSPPAGRDPTAIASQSNRASHPQKPKPRFEDDADGERGDGTFGLMASATKPMTSPGLQVSAARPQGRSINMVTDENPDVAAEIASIDGKIASVQQGAHMDPNAAAQLAALQQRRNSLSVMV